MPLDKLKKADKLQRNRSRQRRRVEKQRSGRDAVPSQRQTVCCSCHLEIGPKPVDDTFTLNFAEWLRKESYDVGDKWYYQQDNELYTSAGNAFHLQQYYLLIKNKISHGSILCKFYLYVYTNNVVLRNGLLPVSEAM
jgi:hypothetical protein